MKAVAVHRMGPFREVLQVVENFPRPTISKPTQILVQVQACSISPGDFRRVRGDIDAVWNPVIKPFVPGMDLCGIVTEVGSKVTEFKQGDAVVGCDGSFLGGLAEYAVIESKYCQRKPKRLGYAASASLATSALRALITVDRLRLKSTDRVLVIGASGGIGIFLVQLLKTRAQVSFVAAVSSQVDLVKSLGADVVVDYRSEDWWTRKDFLAHPFDAIIDCVGGPDNWVRSCLGVLKPRSGRFIATAMDFPNMTVHRKSDLAAFLFPLLGRILRSRLSFTLPRYSMNMQNGEASPAKLAELFALVDQGKVRVVLDPPTPYAFTTEAVQDAYVFLEAHHAHGKIVINVVDNNDGDQNERLESA